MVLLIILMAMSTGILELLLARTQRDKGHLADGLLLALAGAASLGFAVVFLALGLRWIQLEQGSHSDLFWLGSYFGFSAICLLALALALHNLGPSQPSQLEPLPPFENPKLAH